MLPTRQSDWSNPENWSGGPIEVYFSKRDRRLWVPKRKPRWGWTLNMAHPYAGVLVVGTIVLAMLLPAVATHLS